ncbi:MAG: L,D-transpeptidase [Chlamydiia bacterium]|nr:L,D-transpeptidase [Chlamydiia bacterium]
MSTTAKYLFVTVAGVFIVIGGMGMLRHRAPRAKKPAPAPVIVEEISLKEPAKAPVPVSPENLPDVDRIGRFFALDSSRLPIVETLSYTSRVPWLEGRPAWIADYATHYETSRHFIARSLNRKRDYFTQKISFGDRFNVLRRDMKIAFHLLIDLSRCRMWFYYFNPESNERVLLKTYRVGVGRVDKNKASGYLTPLGKYQLGEKVTIYKPGTLGFFQDQKTEMIRVFGTRWIPFESEIEGCTESAKGFGLHGAPWSLDPVSGVLVEDRNKIGKYESDGCIRLAQEDIEEIFAIIISKPTTVELVKDFHDAKLPGVERDL